MNPERLAALVGRGIDRIEPIVGGGYTPALRLRVHLDDGSTVFAKVATNEVTAEMMTLELAAYDRLGRQPFLPERVAADEGVLVLEDLSHGRWPPPWEQGDIDRVREVLEAVATTRVHGLPRLADTLVTLLPLWRQMDLDALASVGVERSWLDEVQPALADAASAARLDGDDLVHVDLRSDNLCLLPDRVVLVDWNNAAIGNAAFDPVAWAPSLHLEGGPAPWELLPDADAGLVAVLAGYFADRAPQPPITDAPRVRPFQLAQLGVCLPWVSRLLGLRPPAWAAQ